MTQERERS